MRPPSRAPGTGNARTSRQQLWRPSCRCHDATRETGGRSRPWKPESEYAAPSLSARSTFRRNCGSAIRARPSPDPQHTSRGGHAHAQDLALSPIPPRGNALAFRSSFAASRLESGFAPPGCWLCSSPIRSGTSSLASRSVHPYQTHTLTAQVYASLRDGLTGRSVGRSDGGPDRVRPGQLHEHGGIIEFHEGVRRAGRSRALGGYPFLGDAAIDPIEEFLDINIYYDRVAHADVLLRVQHCLSGRRDPLPSPAKLRIGGLAVTPASPLARFKRSSTVGTPAGRTLPDTFGIFTQLTGSGPFASSKSWDLVLSQESFSSAPWIPDGHAVEADCSFVNSTPASTLPGLTGCGHRLHR